MNRYEMMQARLAGDWPQTVGFGIHQCPVCFALVKETALHTQWHLELVEATATLYLTPPKPVPPPQSVQEHIDHCTASTCCLGAQVGQ